MAGIRLINSIPQIGYGTWNRDGQVAYDCVRCALDTGYRHIDTAEGYNNEEFVGRAISDSGIPRHEIFLHYPSINDEFEIEDYMAQFAGVFDAGMTKRIGVSNFTKKHIDRALDLLGDRPISTNQFEIHPFLQNRPVVDHCRRLGIPLTAYSPLGRGSVADSDTLAKIGVACGATPPQVALAFLMAEGFIVIPSSTNPARVASNFAAKDIELGEEDIARIRELDIGKRLIDGPWCPESDKD